MAGLDWYQLACGNPGSGAEAPRSGGKLEEADQVDGCSVTLLVVNSNLGKAKFESTEAGWVGLVSACLW
jgi:hypothetical protein